MEAPPATETFRVLPSAIVPPPGTMDPAALRTVHWVPQPLLWLAPFLGATGAYLLSSAFILGTRYRVRWMIGAIVTVAALSAVGAMTHNDWLRFAPLNVVDMIYQGPYGLDALLTARTESLHTKITLSTGSTVGVWRDLPNTGERAIATHVAAARHRERRRP